MPWQSSAVRVRCSGRQALALADDGDGAQRHRCVLAVHFSRRRNIARRQLCLIGSGGVGDCSRVGMFAAACCSIGLIDTYYFESKRKKG